MRYAQAPAGVSTLILAIACGGVLLLVLLFGTFAPSAVAQMPSPWDPIPKSDLELSDNPADPGGVAMILDRNVYRDDEEGFERHRVRIKIFKDQGRENADVVIPYGPDFSVEDVRGRTVRSDGTEIPFNGSVFDTIIVKYKKFRYRAKSFSLPGVEVGAVLEYTYTYRWKEWLPESFRHPSRYEIEGVHSIPTSTWTINDRLFTRHALFTLRPAKGVALRSAQVRFSDHPNFIREGELIKLKVVNVPALEEEPYMPPEEMLNSRVHFFYTLGGGLGYWRSYGVRQAEAMEKFLEPTKDVIRLVAQIAPLSEQPETRLRKIYARVQQIRNVTYEAARTEKEIKRENLDENRGVDDVLRRGYGFGNEINFVFVAMARAAGFKAYVVEVVDRSKSLFEPQVWDPSQLNAVVAMVEVEGRKRMFDPASRFCPFGLVPWEETDTYGVRWDNTGGEVVLSPSEGNDAAVTRRGEFQLLSSGDLEGTVDVEFSGQEALDRRNEMRHEDDVGKKNYIEDEVSGWLHDGSTLSDLTITGWQTPDEPLRVRCRVRIPKFATFTKTRLLLRPAIFQQTRRISFRHNRRVHPLYFGHSSRELDTINIRLPEEYSVEAMPQEVRQLRESTTFQTKYRRDGNVVTLERQWNLIGYLYPGTSYAALRQYFQLVRQSDMSYVVLRH